MFHEILSPALIIFWQIFKNWWWVLLPFFLWKPLTFLYRFWRMEVWDSTIPKVWLEIKLPQDVIKPIKAMEHVFAGFHAIHDVITWREKWIEGQFQLRFALEIVSIGGEIHFYIRVPKRFRDIIESNIYSQYPEAEISEVSDYTLNVPADIPNKEWELWGTDIINTKPNPYPIKTYTKFESEAQPVEEKRVDPLAGLLEGMSLLKPGEQLWVQIIVKPIREQDKDWVSEGHEIRDKLARRPEKPKPKPMVQEAAEILAFGVEKPGEKEKELIPPEMKLTPGEREIIAGIEEKITKFGFDCNIRYIYLAKRDVYFGPRARIPYSFFKEVSYENLGGFKPEKRTMTKVKSVFFWFLDKRRLYIRKRRIFRYYKRRWIPYFPRSGGNYVLNTEELATLFHFPGRITAPAPGLPRIEAKKGGATPGLPVE
jgi:hypothetical protein